MQWPLYVPMNCKDHGYMVVTRLPRVLGAALPPSSFSNRACDYNPFVAKVEFSHFHRSSYCRSANTDDQSAPRHQSRAEHVARRHMSVMLLEVLLKYSARAHSAANRQPTERQRERDKTLRRAERRLFGALVAAARRESRPAAPPYRRPRRRGAMAGIRRGPARSLIRSASRHVAVPSAQRSL